MCAAPLPVAPAPSWQLAQLPATPLWSKPVAGCHAVVRWQLLHSAAVAMCVGDFPVTVVPSGGRIDLGPFSVEFIPVAHSIPESHALAIHTSADTVLHNGD